MRHMSVFAVTKVRTGPLERVTDVLRGVVDTKSNRWVSAEVVAPVAEVLDAIHNGDQVVALFAAADGHLPQRQFAVLKHADGSESIALDGPSMPGREIHHMDQLDP